MDPHAATRPILWNISHAWVMYALLAPTLAVAAFGVWRRVRIWRRGQPLMRFDRPWDRARMVMKHALFLQRTVREKFPGAYHSMIFFGFIVLTIATIVVMLDYDFGASIMHGYFYLYFQSLIVDIFGVLTIVGVLLAAARRRFLRPKQLVYSPESIGLLGLILVISVTGFLLEGWRIAATADPWGPWSPVGYVVSKISLAALSDPTILIAHRVTWWCHLALVFGLIAWAPYTKLLHVATAPLNAYFAHLGPSGGSLKRIDFDAVEKLGVSSAPEFTWKDLLDFDACTECGRCTASCPANAVGKTLSPRDLILDLQDWIGRPASFGEGADAVPSFLGATPALSPDALWACTTCGACVEACPVFIEQLPKIVDARRFLVMEEADFPDTMQDAITSLESRGHPFRGTQASRADWMEGLDVPLMTNVKEADVLLWVGCGGALLERNQKVVRAIAQLLATAGVSYAVLGRDEKCTGDPARRIGNEFLFESLAKDNIESLKKYRFKKIVTSCPHCFNAFRNEYPELGGEYIVQHHSEFLEELVRTKRLTVGAGVGVKATFHDPCYLGRHNGVFDPPRELVQMSVGAAPREMVQSREKGFCCGGGGGMSFIDEPPRQRVNQERARQALATDANVVAVGCPFCMTMLEDGVKAVKPADRELRVLDVAELLWENVSATSKKA